MSAIKVEDRSAHDHKKNNLDIHFQNDKANCDQSLQAHKSNVECVLPRSRNYLVDSVQCNTSFSNQNCNYDTNSLDLKKKFESGQKLCSTNDVEWKENQSNSSLSCGVCQEQFVSSLLLKSHICSKLESQEHCSSVICVLCKESFNTINSLKCHLMETDCTGFICVHCSQTFELEYLLLMHVAKCHTIKDGEALECKSCGKTFSSMLKFYRHAGTHAKSRPFLCKICKNQYLANDHLVLHLKAKHRISKGNVKSVFDENKKLPNQFNVKNKKTKEVMTCNVCEKTFTKGANLRHHMRSHTRPFLCSSCGKSFSQSIYLKDHINANHRGDNPYKCEDCDKVYRSRASLKLHRRTHTGINMFPCEKCGKSFMDFSCLRSHMQTHSLEKPFKCTICEFSCKRKTTLSSHILTHYNIRKHRCPICDKLFSQSTHLKAHMVIHGNERNHSCNICGRTFLRIDYLRVHMRTHTKEKPYLCPVCGRTFAMRSNMTSHLRNIHPDFNYHYKPPRLVTSQLSESCKKTLLASMTSSSASVLEAVIKAKEEPIDDFIDSVFAAKEELKENCRESVPTAKDEASESCDVATIREHLLYIRGFEKDERPVDVFKKELQSEANQASFDM